MEKNFKIQFNKEVRRLADKIKKEYRPEKILIFGSYASGKITKDSDVDFLIIKKTSKKRMDRNREVHRILLDRKIPVDILVYTPSEIQNRKKIGDSFILNIINSGKEIYAKR